MVLAAGDRIKIYSSSNLKQWTHESDFFPDIKEPYGVWECPDLFPMKVGKTETEKWVLILSQNSNGPNGGSATRYIVGDFDGKQFTALSKPKWIDNGPDYYAGVTFDNVPKGKRILLGWMSNWLYADKTPTKNWRSAMALPRELQLENTIRGYHLWQRVISNHKVLTSRVPKSDLTFQKMGQVENFRPSTYWVKITGFDVSNSIITIDPEDDLTVIISNQLGERVTVEIDEYTGWIRVDRSASGVVNFNKDFSNALQMQATFGILDKVRLLIDRSSIEIGVHDGSDWMTVQVFPTEPYSILEYKNGLLENIKVERVRSIWIKP